MSNSKGIALITGASSGIGAIYADRLARRGLDLVLVARDGARMETLAQRLRHETGAAIEVLAADLTAEADLLDVERRLGAGDVTLLINNAGMSLDGDILDNGVAELAHIIALNITAPTRLASVAARAFVAAGHGAIVNLASVLALLPERSEGVYSGSKAFILNLSQAMTALLADKGVHVQAVLPGATRTEIWARSGKDVDAFPEGMVMEVDDLVDAALVGLDRNEAITIPPLADEGLWITMQDARLAMGPHLSRSAVAARYGDVALT